MNVWYCYCRDDIIRIIGGRKRKLKGEGKHRLCQHSGDRCHRLDNSIFL